MQLDQVRIAHAFSLFGMAFESLAEAFRNAPAGSTPSAEAGVRDSSPNAPVTDPTDTIEDKETTLEDLQHLGAKLIKAGRRNSLLEVMGLFDLQNLSSAKQSQYPQIATALQEALNR